MEKINIAQIIKDCPKGMELDCTIWNSEAKVFLKEVRNDDFTYPIVVTIKYNNIEYSNSFTKYGADNDCPYCKCVIFPKGKTTWEGFVPPCKFKVGDKVRHKGATSCGTVYEIEQIKRENNQVKYIICNLYWKNCKCTVTAEDLQPYKEETMEELRIDFPEGYGYAGIENKQVIFTKIKPQYPKTYDECCNVLGLNNAEIKVLIHNIEHGEAELYRKFIELKRCRDAYWKIAGNWKPYFTNKEQKKFTISIIQDEIEFSGTYVRNSLLAFPTVEMRDAFYENFKDLIEQCKELL